VTDFQKLFNFHGVIEIGRQESLLVVAKWVHWITIGQSLSEFGIVEFNEQVAPSLVIARRLSLGAIENFVVDLLSEGQTDALLNLLDRLLPIPFTNSIDVLIDSLPTEVTADQLISISQKLLSSSPMLSKHKRHLCALVDVLHNRAQDFALSTTADALTLVLYLLSLIDQFSADLVDSAPFLSVREKLASLHKHLQLQTIAHDILHLRLSLSEVMDQGFEGLMFDRLDTLAESDVNSFIVDSLSPLCSLFSLSVDELLMQWIEYTTTNCWISASDSDCNEDDMIDDMDDDVNETSMRRDKDDFEADCELSRLILVTKAISHKSTLAKATLKMFQIPRVERKCVNTQTETFITPCGVSLCELASLALLHVDNHFRDQLVEALRLFNIKMLASKYNIEHFDVRDNHHLLATMAIIASTQPHSRHTEQQSTATIATTSLGDAMKFALDGTTFRVDVKPIMLRRLYRFASLTSIEHSQYDAEYAAIIQHVPSRRSLQDILNEFVLLSFQEMNDLSNEVKVLATKKATSPDDDVAMEIDGIEAPLEGHVAASSQNVDEEEELNPKFRLMRFTKCAIKTVETFLDEFDNDYSSPLTSSSIVASSSSLGFQTNQMVSPKKEWRRSISASSSVCTHDLLLELKRLFQLQSAYDIFDFSVLDLRRQLSCRALIERLTTIAVTQWMQQIDSSANSQSIDEQLNSFAAEFNKLRRVCGIVHVSHEMLVHSISKRLMINGKKVCCCFNDRSFCFLLTKIFFLIEISIGV
jgi:hypothetical protein